MGHASVIAYFRAAYVPPDLAKTSPHILHPERFALHLGTYLVSKYAHIHKAFVTIEQLRWHRIDVNGQQHNHSFYRDGDWKRLVDVTVRTLLVPYVLPFSSNVTGRRYQGKG